jgi:hypothetical protein
VAGIARSEKAALVSPMGNISTNDQYLINPVYETEIMTDCAKKSVMMPLVRHRPMMGPFDISAYQRPERGGTALAYRLRAADYRE